MKNKRILALAAALVLLLAGFGAGYAARSLIARRAEEGVTEGLLRELSGDKACYVIGHKSPDTDTVCSAMLLADILSGAGIPCEARVTGRLNPETAFVLDYFGLSAPEILEHAGGKTVILVDHSEKTQMAEGMDAADVIGVIDHHAVGNLETDGPIVYQALNVGSTATVICEYYLKNSAFITPKAAALILSAILSDTNNLTSSTTTPLDRDTLARMAGIAGVKSVDDLYAQMSEAAESYTGMTDEEIFYSDYKEYDMSGTPVGIACVNAADRSGTEAMAEKMERVMAGLYPAQSMKHLFAVIKNGKDNCSVIIGCGEGVGGVLRQAFGSEDHVFEPAASRKKDVVPALERVYQAGPAF